MGLLLGHWVCGSALSPLWSHPVAFDTVPFASTRDCSRPTGAHRAQICICSRAFNCVIFCRVARSGPLIAGVSFSQCLGATSNSHSHSQPCCSHSWQTGLHSRHCSRYRQQRAHGGRPTLEPQPIKPLFDAANLTIFWQTAAPTATQTRIFQKFSPASGGIGGLSPKYPAGSVAILICQNFNVLSCALPGSPAPAPCCPFTPAPGPVVFVLRFAPPSFYPISGSSTKTQRGDEEYADAAAAVLFAVVADGPAFAP